MSTKEMMNANGGLIGWLVGGACAAIIIAGGVKAYNHPSMDIVNDAVCDTFGHPLPFKACK